MYPLTKSIRLSSLSTTEYLSIDHRALSQLDYNRKKAMFVLIIKLVDSTKQFLFITN